MALKDIIQEIRKLSTADQYRPTNVLCTDAWRAFMTYEKEKGLEYYRFKSDGKERYSKCE